MDPPSTKPPFTDVGPDVEKKDAKQKAKGKAKE